jgi:Tol biopolymer transport system component
MRRALIALGLLAGCGNVKNMADAPPVTGDVPLIDTPMSDTPSNAWGAPVKLTTVSTASDEWGPTVRTDLLEMYFASDRAGTTFNDIYVSTRPTAASPWGAPAIVTELSTTGAELQPSLSRDGLTIYITQFAGANGFDIYKATRTSLTAAWGTPAVSSELNSTADEAPMNMSTSGLAMVVTSTRPGSAGYDVYLATRGSTSQTFGAPVAIASANTTNNEYDAWLSDDALTIYYTSDINAANSNDLFVATRTTAGGAFTTPTALTALNSSASDEDPWVSTDQHTMIFSSSRDGNRDLWMSTR